MKIKRNGKIHPAVDFTSNHAYVGLKLQVGLKKLPYIIRDDGQAILVDERILQENGISLRHSRINWENRWSAEGIKRFIGRKDGYRFIISYRD